jgi:hypothetical protein
VRILFVLVGSAAHFEPMLWELASRGHEIHVAVRGRSDRCEKLIDAIHRRHPGVTRGSQPVRSDRWVALAEVIGLGRDYLRFLGAEYAQSPKLRVRGERRAPAKFVRLTRLPLVRSRPGIRVLEKTMRWLEVATPDGPEINEFVRAHRPDLLLVSPLVTTTSQAHFVRAARSLGIRSALLVRSWDNLTNKGLIRQVPDRVYVWNEDQRREAVQLHGVPPERVIATGAYHWDHWFGWKPSTTVAQFSELVGLPHDRPTVLYACSSDFVASNEAPFVERWLRALREYPDERLRTANVQIRPYPSNREAWLDSHLAREPGVTIWPMTDRHPGTSADDAARSAYFDSIYHSSAVVGLNTTTMIEAALVGRPVFTVLEPVYAESQHGLPHFHYLPRENGGPVTVGRDFGEHFAQLARALSDGNGPDAADREFVRRFLRPHGLERPALSVLVAAIEEQMGEPRPRPSPARTRRGLAGLALRPLAALTTRSVRPVAPGSSQAEVTA